MELQEILNATASALPIAVFELKDGRVYSLYVNDIITEYYSREAVKPCSKHGILLPHIDEVRNMLRGRAADAEFDGEVESKRKDGKPLWLYVLAKKIKLGGKEFFYTIICDVTERKKRERAIDWQNERYRIFDNLARTVSYDYDSETDTLYFYVAKNDDADARETTIHNYLSEFIDSPSSVVAPGSEEYRNAFELAAKGESHGTAEYRADYYGKGYHSYRTEWFRIVPKDGSGYHLVGMAADIDDELKLRHSAEYDALTNLLNRSTIEVKIDDYLGRGIYGAGDVCVIIDIDNFKEINDSQGHLAGDKALHNLGHILSDSCQATDLAGRTGGDEFFLLFKNKNLVQLETVLSVIEERCSEINSHFYLSMGVYVLDGSERKFIELMKRADLALYRAKAEGKNHWVIYNETKDIRPDFSWAETQLLALEHSILINAVSVSISKHLLDGRFTVVYANARYYEIFGYTKEEYERLFHNRPDLFFKDYPELWESLGTEVKEMFAKGETSYEYLCRMPHKNGKMLWIKLFGNLTGEVIDGYPVSYSVMVDITEQMLIRQEKTVAYGNIPSLIAKYKVTENGYELLSANDKYYEVFPNKTDFPLSELTEENGMKPMADLYDLIRRGERIDCEFSPKNKRGETTRMRVRGNCVDREGDYPIYLLIYEDITELTSNRELLLKKNKELERLAYYDTVTGGINVTRFDELAKRRIRKATPNYYTLVSLNINKFKLTNDLFGKDEGDRVLRYIYAKIKVKINRGELLSRIESDNFSLLLRRDTPLGIVDRLEDIVECINRFPREVKRKYIFTFTAGVYNIEGGDLEMTQMRDRANLARKEVCGLGGTSDCCRCYFYSDTVRGKILFEKEIENKAADALRSRQFEVFLQPKISLDTEKITGAEALVRWRDPERGLIPPSDFIPFFEKNGTVVQLDLYVFREVCKLLSEWIAAGLKPMPISVNLSRVHFASSNFLDKYVEICDEYRVPHELIDIEVTETIVFDNPEAFERNVRRIHKNGFSCSMDDFGSGYSSLNVLKDIDVDTVKLDRAFFSSPEMNDEKEQYVVSSMVELIKKLKMVSLAEGVETEKQKEFLKEIRCNLVQGYVYSKPLPVGEFENLAFGRDTRKLP